jgi:hypothetical protein
MSYYTTRTALYHPNSPLYAAKIKADIIRKQIRGLPARELIALPKLEESFAHNFQIFTNNLYKIQQDFVLLTSVVNVIQRQENGGRNPMNKTHQEIAEENLRFKNRYNRIIGSERENMRREQFAPSRALYNDEFGISPARPDYFGQNNPMVAGHESELLSPDQAAEAAQIFNMPDIYASGSGRSHRRTRRIQGGANPRRRVSIPFPESDEEEEMPALIPMEEEEEEEDPNLRTPEAIEPHSGIVYPRSDIRYFAQKFTPEQRAAEEAASRARQEAESASQFANRQRLENIEAHERAERRPTAENIRKAEAAEKKDRAAAKKAEAAEKKARDRVFNTVIHQHHHYATKEYHTKETAAPIIERYKIADLLIKITNDLRSVDVYYRQNIKRDIKFSNQGEILKLQEARDNLDKAFQMLYRKPTPKQMERGIILSPYQYITGTIQVEEGPILWEQLVANFEFVQTDLSLIIQYPRRTFENPDDDILLE